MHASWNLHCLYSTCNASERLANETHRHAKSVFIDVIQRRHTPKGNWSSHRADAAANSEVLDSKCRRDGMFVRTRVVMTFNGH